MIKLDTQDIKQLLMPLTSDDYVRLNLIERNIFFKILKAMPDLPTGIYNNLNDYGPIHKFMAADTKNIKEDINKFIDTLEKLVQVYQETFVHLENSLTILHDKFGNYYIVPKINLVDTTALDAYTTSRISNITIKEVYRINTKVFFDFFRSHSCKVRRGKQIGIDVYYSISGSKEILQKALDDFANFYLPLLTMIEIKGS